MIGAGFRDNLRNTLKEQATPRALIGLAALVLILMIWAFGELTAAVSSLKSDAEELQRARRLELSLLSDQGWLEQANALENQLDEIQSDFWAGSTNGIIAAQLQGAVEAAARNANLRNIRVSVESMPNPLGTHARSFEISLTARDERGQFLTLFQELSRSEHQIIITSFNWRRSNGSLTLRLEAPARNTTEDTTP